MKTLNRDNHGGHGNAKGENRKVFFSESSFMRLLQDKKAPEAPLKEENISHAFAVARQRDPITAISDHSL
jgi:hypothetical protein